MAAMLPPQSVNLEISLCYDFTIVKSLNLPDFFIWVMMATIQPCYQERASTSCRDEAQLRNLIAGRASSAPPIRQNSNHRSHGGSPPGTLQPRLASIISRSSRGHSCISTFAWPPLKITVYFSFISSPGCVKTKNKRALFPYISSVLGLCLTHCLSIPQSGRECRHKTQTLTPASPWQSTL